jgi:hypothetical protein
MEPVTAAILAAVGKAVEPAVRDAYDALKRLIARKLGSGNAVSQSITHLEGEPGKEWRRNGLVQEVAESRLATDQEVIAAAVRLLQLSGADKPSSATQVNQHVSGSGNVFTGTGDIKL